MFHISNYKKDLAEGNFISIARAISSIENEEFTNIKPTSKVIWLGGEPSIKQFSKTKKGVYWQMFQLTFFDKNENFEITVPQDKGEWLLAILSKLSINEHKSHTFLELKTDFENQLENFEMFWYSKPIDTLRNHGLLLL